MNWSFEEDYIVCEFYLSHVNSWRAHIDELMLKLSESGFIDREKGSAIMRVQNVESLHTGKGLSNVAKQTKNVYAAMIEKINNPAKTEKLKAYISQNYIEPETENIYNSNTELIDDFVMTKPIGPTFSEVLFKFIDKYGYKDSQVYHSCSLSRKTFSDIRNHRGNVSKKTVMQLCFGVKLTYDESVELMEAAGYAFSNNNMLDIIVKWHLEQRIYSTLEVDCVLYENNIRTLFS